MPINPLPQFEADLFELEEDRKAYAELTRPKTLVVRFGAMGLIGEFSYGGDVKPGCGSKVVARTPRGLELGELLTTTCTNAGCGKSVTRHEMLDFIKVSGGKDYPFYSNGKVLRIATMEDMDNQAKIEQSRHNLKTDARERVERLGLKMKVVDAEPILGGERLTFYYMADERVELHDLVGELGAHHRTRVDMKQVGARDEARLVADYEKCGQYCCCKNFLKVLRPVSMRSAKVQKATLDPLKISGRCGRLMCCLRYEDQTYTELKKNLPRRKARVGTPHGDGIVIDSQILTQLVLVSLDADESRVAVPVEDLGEVGMVVQSKTPPPAPAKRDRRATGKDAGRRGRGGKPGGADRPEKADKSGRGDKRGAKRPVQDETASPEKTEGGTSTKKRRRRRKRKSQGTGERATPGAAQTDAPREPSSSEKNRENQGSGNASDAGSEGASGGKRKRRRRRRGGRGGPGGNSDDNTGGQGERGNNPGAPESS
jgi:cell fate regulator YaaT (PSP1 superfamily)